MSCLPWGDETTGDDDDDDDRDDGDYDEDDGGDMIKILVLKNGIVDLWCISINFSPKILAGANMAVRWRPPCLWQLQKESQGKFAQIH